MFSHPIIRVLHIRKIHPGRSTRKYLPRPTRTSHWGGWIISTEDPPFRHNRRKSPQPGVVHGGRSGAPVLMWAAGIPAPPRQRRTNAMHVSKKKPQGTPTVRHGGQCPGCYPGSGARRPVSERRWPYGQGDHRGKPVWGNPHGVDHLGALRYPLAAAPPGQTPGGRRHRDCETATAGSWAPHKGAHSYCIQIYRHLLPPVAYLATFG